jgi:hypothetical protein
MLANANVAPICEERDRVAPDGGFAPSPQPNAGA